MTSKLVLVVDDTPEDRRLLQYYFRQVQWETVEAVDGEAGLALVRQHHPDLVVCDAMMPRLDGFQLLRAVRSSPELEGIPFIMYTSSYVSSRDRDFSLALGADAWLEKPMDPEDFLREVAQVLRRREQGKVPPPTICSEDDFLRRYHDVLMNKIRTIT